MNPRFRGPLIIAAFLTMTIPVLVVAQELSPPSITNGDCMGVSQPDPSFPNLPACAGNKDAVKKPEGDYGVIWRLVAQRSANGKTYQVWYDSTSGLIWSDILDSAYTHYEAIDVDFFSRLVRKEIACISAEGQLAEAGIGSKKWGLPTAQEYLEAESHGIRKVLPNMNHWFWSRSIHSDKKDYALYFGGIHGEVDYGTRVSDYVVRCVGR